MEQNTEEKIYTLGGRRWVQRPLTLNEWVKVREIFRGTSARLEANQESFAQFFDALMTSGKLNALAEIVLKPYTPTLREKIRARLSKVGVGDVVGTSPVLGEVVRDFFFLNVSWVEAWLNMPLNLESPLMREMTLQGILSTLLSFFMRPQVATSFDETLRGTSSPKT